MARRNMLRGRARQLMAMREFPAGGITHLLRDDFATAVAAGFSSPRTAEPSPGKLARSADTANRVSVDAGDLLWSGGTAVSYADPAYYYTDDAGNGITRAHGYTAILALINSDVIKYGFATSTTVANANQFSFLLNAAGSTSYARQGTNITIGSWAAATAYLLAATLRANGLELRIKGGAYSEWSLLFVDTSGFNNSPVWVALSSAGTPTARSAKVRAAGGNDVGKLATASEIISASSPDTTILTAKADGLFQLNGTVPAGAGGNLLELRYRQADANNYMLQRVEWNGSNYQLVTGHVIAGVETLQGSPVTSLTSAGNTLRFNVRAVGNNHDYYTAPGSTWTKQYGTISDSSGAANTGVSVRNVGFTSTSILCWDYQDAVIASTLDRLAA